MDKALTLADIKATLTPDGLPAQIIDTMATSGSLTEDGLWKPTNAFGRNVTARTLSVPDGEFRRANKGITPGKGSIGQIEDYVGYIEAMSFVDDKVIRSVKKGNKAQARATYDKLFSSGLASQGRQFTIYGSREADPEAFNGMAAKRNKIDNIYTIDCTPSTGFTVDGKRTSIFLVAWDGDRGCHYLYPEETAAGITTEDFGKQIIPDPNNDPAGPQRYLPAWITWFYYDLGFTVKDDRALIRLCNIDLENKSSDYMKEVLAKLNQAARTLSFDPGSGKVKAYCNMDMEVFLDNMVLNLANFEMTQMTIEGKTFTSSIVRIPLRRCDEISSAEVAVTA